jgi:hypothetical protein
MDSKSDERWKVLCEQAAHELDPEKLLTLVQEINHLLEQKDLGNRDSKKQSAA